MSRFLIALSEHRPVEHELRAQIRRWIQRAGPAVLALGILGCDGIPGDTEGRPERMTDHDRAATSADTAGASETAPAEAAAGNASETGDGPSSAPRVASIPQSTPWPPTPTTAPSPVPTSPPRLRQVTEGGCCVQPRFSDDGMQIQFIDQPADDAPTGYYGVPADGSRLEPTLVTEEIGFSAGGGAFRQEFEGSVTRLTDPATGESWTLPTTGQPVSVSPDLQRVAWEVENDASWENEISRVWVSNLDGSEQRQVATLPRGSFRGWIDDQRILVEGREDVRAEDEIISILDVDTGEQSDILRGDRLRGMVFSPDRSRMVYYATQQDDPADNGFFVIDLEAGATPRRLDVPFGAYRWRNASELLVIPLEPGPAHRLLQHHVDAGRSVDLTPDRPFKVANGDWTVSPDGSQVAFVSAGDKNVWVMDLPPLE